MSGGASIESAEEVLRLGAVAYLLKAVQLSRAADPGLRMPEGHGRKIDITVSAGEYPLRFSRWTGILPSLSPI